MNIKEILALHEEWLKGDPNGVRANLSHANLRYADLSHADLSDANLRYADLSDADLSHANLRYADLSHANLRYADLSDADLRYADLSDANLRYADLSDADLSHANLRYADLSHADLRYANLSDAEGLLSAIDYLLEHFERTDEGFIAYKTFGGEYNPPEKWVIQPGSIITENVNHNRADVCGCGINVAPFAWVNDNYGKKWGEKQDIWKVLIRYEWLAGVCVPYHTDGKIRCERVQLIKIVEEV